MRVARYLSMVLVIAVAVAAHGSERAKLTNGYEILCHHHATVNEHVRLYLSAGEDNYVDMKPTEILGFEPAPDPPAAAAGTQGAAKREARLSRTDLAEMLAKAGHEHNLDVDLLASIVKAESNGDARAVSRAGAEGLMQLMPKTATGLGVTDSFEPDDNVRGGSAYMDALLTRYHENLALALAAYNAGPAAVDKYHGIPPYRETQAYVARVIHEFNRRVAAREAQRR